MELGLSHLQLGQLAFDRPDSSALMGMKRGSSPTYERLSAIARALGLELYLGLPRAAGLAEEAVPTDLGKAEAIRAGYMPIPWHELARHKHRPPICVDQGWLDRHKLDAATLAMVQPARIHARPAVAEHIALVDTSARPAPDAQLWAFVERGTVTIGVIQNDRQALLLHGAEHGDQVRIVTDKEREAIRMLGRAVWIGSLATSTVD